MTTTPFLISDFKQGLERDLQPWLLPRDAFPNLINAYLFRGVIRKKGGSTLISPDVDTPTAATDINKSRIKDNTAMANVLDGPILGLMQRELTAINQEQLLGWGSDSLPTTTAYVNVFNNTTESFVPNMASPSWTATSETFFWGRNYFQSLWVTTNNSVDPIRYTFDPSALGPVPPPWHNFTPIINLAGNVLDRALLILPYKNRLLVLNTTENGVRFRQRARWSQNGTPYIDSTMANRPPNTGFDVTAWRHDIIGKGGFIDAPTQEQIISADFYKDTLIVFFERSTWQLRYTGNELLPFIWDRVNSERGAESTWSSVRLEEGLAAIGYNGVMVSNGVNTERVDWKIPDEVFRFGNQQNIVKIRGIRDFWGENIYWNFVSIGAQNDALTELPNYPDSLLYYNYKEQTWALFVNSYTVFSHYSTFDDRAWNDFVTKGKDEWEHTEGPWNDPQNIKGFPKVIAGTQQGFVHFLYTTGPNNSVPGEAISLLGSAVAGTVASISHNLKVNSFFQVFYSDNAAVNGNIYKVNSRSRDAFGAEDSAGAAIPDFNDGYMRVVENFNITTKRLNPVVEKGKMGRMVYMDVYVENPQDELLNLDRFNAKLFIDNNSSEFVQTIQIEATTVDEKVWKRVFFNSTGNFFTVEFGFNEAQMFNPQVSVKDVQIHALMFHMREAGGRLTK